MTRILMGTPCSYPECGGPELRAAVAEAEAHEHELDPAGRKLVRAARRALARYDEEEPDRV